MFFSFSTKAQTEVAIYTNYGTINLALYDTIVPNTVSNFVNLVSQKFYDGVIFHRVIDNFMIQGGDGSPTPPSIIDEFDVSLSNIQGTISMANSGPNTGTCQFFINLVNNTYLDFNKAPLSSKHPVFGNTINGFNIVENIGAVQTDGNDAPLVAVVMDSVRIVNQVLAVTDQEIVNNNRNLVKIIDVLGHESKVTIDRPLFYIYDDGSVEKKINLPY
ncbi:MAG: peptidylprolyl isomerase [Flavobacteriales bacterium]|nr:peptidylprolyl isomerase [Flavobacteriales bacterium]MBT5090567.1 peptidylprolyl isomerase [Flavobacteriales bacterium]MBT5614897.1 peptidylprolyl isomerase [Flavobacteriales bacterium]MBT5749519.1 peptidylprolyl isomerase [Flavobacteriales bacterium]